MPRWCKRIVCELAGGIIHGSLLISRPIHPSTIYRTNQVFSPVFLLGKQKRCDSKKYCNSKHGSFHF